MKKIFVVFLAINFVVCGVLPYSDFRELGKIPFLIEHYQQHKSENSGIGFFTFLALHYTNTQHQKTGQSHHKLPLLNAHAINAVFKFEMPVFYFKNDCYFPVISKEDNFSYHSSLLQMVVRQLIKPPMA